MEGNSKDRENGCNTQALLQERYQVQDGYKVCFAEQPPKEIQIECCICLEFLSDPCLVDCQCGNSFCRTCIETVQNSNRLCPLCECKFTIILPSRQLQRTLRGLHIHCPHMDHGCNWTSELRKLSEHLNTNPSVENRLQGCDYVVIKCGLCPEYHQRRAIPYHENRLCPERLYTCEHCNAYSSTFREVYSNHWPQCVGFHAVCESSGFRMRSETKELVDWISGQSLEESVDNQCLDIPTGCDLLHYCELLRKRSRKNTQVEADSMSELCTLPLRQPEIQEAGPKQRQRLNGSQISLTMNNVSRYEKPEYIWYSQPFHTHRHGYNMCLGVQLNDDRDNRGGYVSVNVHLLKGKFDHEILWPFQGEVTIKLLSQETDRHHSITVKYDESMGTEYAGRRYEDEEKSAGLGKPNFIARRSLLPTFLTNDTLHFKVHCVVHV